MLVSPRHVVTAAHCVTPQLTAVVLGEHDRAATFDCLDPELGCEEPDTLACVEAEQCAPASQTVPLSQVHRSLGHIETLESVGALGYPISRLLSQLDLVWLVFVYSIF